MANLTNIHQELTSNQEMNFLSSINDNNNFGEDFFVNSPYSTTEFNCSYVTEDIFINNPSVLNKFNILSLNIQSLSSKFEQFKILINNLSISNREPSVICLQELWKLNPDCNFDLPGYQPLVFKSRSNNVQGGGVGFYVKIGISFNLLHNFSLFHDRIFESIFIGVEISDNKILTIGSCYRPNIYPTLTGSEQFDSFLDIFSNLCSSLPNNSYIFGDFHLNLLSYSNNRQVTEYLDTLFSYGFLQNITYPTRVSNASATLIDHVICNSNTLVRDSYILISDISDHYPIIFSLNKLPKKPKSKPEFQRKFSNDQLLSFGNALKNINWDPITSSDNPNTAYDHFEETFIDLYNLYFPLSPKKFCRRTSPIEDWMSRGLLISRNEKLRLFSLSKSNPTPFNTLTYKTYRNIFNSAIRTVKKLQYEKLFCKAKFNLKQTWTLFNKANNKKPKK